MHWHNPELGVKLLEFTTLLHQVPPGRGDYLLAFILQRRHLSCREGIYPAEKAFQLDTALLLISKLT